MNSTTLSHKNHEAEKPAASPVFSAVAIYDDFFGGIRAREALEWLKHSLSSDLQVCSTFWSFQSLERLDVRAASLRAAATADVLIIAASEMEPLPDQIKRWLDSILQQQRGGRAVLVALYDGDETPCDTPGPLCSYLEHEAGRWQTDCMCNRDFDQRLNCEYALQFVSQKRPAPSLLNQPFEMDHRNSAPVGWGINE